MAKALDLDVETTKVPRHYPWVDGSYLVSVHIYSLHEDKHYDWLVNHPEATLSIAEVRSEAQEVLDRHDWLLNQNLKFDLHWMDELGLHYDHMQLFDTQYAEYLRTGQRVKLANLDELCEIHDIPKKLDKVKQMWDLGMETDEIPANILIPYGQRDVKSTAMVAKKQIAELYNSSQWVLFKIKMRELLMLKRAERSGMLMNTDHLQQAADEYQVIIEKTTEEMLRISGNEIENVSSPAQKSCMLFGGEFKSKMELQEFKSLPAGPVCYCIESVGRKWVNYTKKVQGVGFTPPNGSETANPGQYSTDAATIAALVCKNKTQRRILACIKELNKLSKIRSTYLIGLQKHVQDDGLVHPTYKQPWTSTGRLASEKPNGQNFPREKTGPVKGSVETRHKEPA